MALVPLRNNDNELVDSNVRFRAIDKSSGIQVVKGGITKDSSVFDSIISAYSNLIYHPFALGFLIFGCFILLAEYHRDQGPLELIGTLIYNAVRDKDTPMFAKTALVLVSKMVSLLIGYKIFFGKICLVWFSYIAKPSSRNLWYSMILTGFVLLKVMNYFEIFVLTQIYYLFVMVRKPIFKFVLVVIFVCIFIIEIIDINKYMVVETKNYRPPPAPQPVPKKQP